MLHEAALEFHQMRLTGVEPNYITFITLLSGCAHFPSNSLPFGISIHGYVYKLGLDKNNVSLGTALVDMYAKCGNVEVARVIFDKMVVKNSMSWNTMIDGYMRNGGVDEGIDLFDRMSVRDKVSWTALISGFVKKDCFEEALDWFRKMQISGVEPDYVTVITVLAACANLGALGLGIWVHRYVLQKGLDKEIRVSNSLIDMYSRCGCIEFARQEFSSMQKRSLVSWNSIIVGFAINGHAEKALEHFSAMQKEGFSPNGVSFTGALTACSHAGLVEKGFQLYDTMTKKHRIRPSIEHYGCLVDLLSRGGRLEDAFRVIRSMPMKPNEVILGSLLAACNTLGNLSLAKKLMGYIVEIDPNCDSNYVLLSNMYAADEKWDSVEKVRKKMKSLGITKKPGFSVVEIDCNIHEFVVGDTSHIYSEQIYEVLDQLSAELNLYGYVPENSGGKSSECD
ncbi:hypothetical protein GIB67_005137 [Kingdonia uniflora]|uniref:Pentatricopeptide repeat-containing protein n=1 Tax=Kingdonia uniflora TaxID=39325 RepID=A0A7J7LAF0_9MAGN|nr:hypothetical protein GIB67_005137 [Kingdonia uniflora]